MSKMKSRFSTLTNRVAVMGAGIAAAASAALSGLGDVISGPEELPRERRKPNNKGPKVRRRLFYARHASRYMPHQGAQEIARRARQIEAGKLLFFVPGVAAEAKRFKPQKATAPKAIPAAVLIAAGEDAERQQKNRLRAEKAARTRAANRAAKGTSQEKSNGTS